MKSDKKEENSEDKIYKVLCNGTDALPTSVTLWHAKLKYLINSGQDELIEQEFNKVNLYLLMKLTIKLEIFFTNYN